MLAYIQISMMYKIRDTCRELGVGEICQRLCRGEYVNLQRFIRSKPGIYEVFRQVFLLF